MNEVNEEKRMIKNYEVRHSVFLGDREVLFAVDRQAELPYLVCGCRECGAFGLRAMRTPRQATTIWS